MVLLGLTFNWSKLRISVDFSCGFDIFQIILTDPPLNLATRHSPRSTDLILLRMRNIKDFQIRPEVMNFVHVWKIVNQDVAGIFLEKVPKVGGVVKFFRDLC